MVILSISLTVECLTSYVLVTTGVIKLGTDLSALVVIYYILDSFLLVIPCFFLFCFMVILSIFLTVKCLTGYVLVTTGVIKMWTGLNALVVCYILDS